MFTLGLLFISISIAFNFPKDYCYHTGHEHRCTSVESLEDRSQLLRGESNVRFFVGEPLPAITLHAPADGAHIFSNELRVAFTVHPRDATTGAAHGAAGRPVDEDLWIALMLSYRYDDLGNC